ncbi:serine/threonine protein kinase, variant 2 [Sphaeroforma arctica JP610]|uniref:Serine/threonine protein kinase, variant 2 n=1 Tax=Sphaeroforma arctica JP610 TaxID=667725 RepID=A0A0L0FIR0_9EUKA|nr:serine/threonine protein kinase, variant 2 [Sphaeroforma arctica JP610]KNC76659.1 serine/threonine protein kinase, variant 2 [Sphaeroforma arctica JP610]|eukprot:XP_014150561.1 serine/threonine protein kinase, variant 2 [Sphaeroforma arctica JP610]
MKEQQVHKAARTRDVTTLSNILQIDESQIGTLDENGGTPLHIASENGHKDVVELLLAKGADTHVKDETGSTPLYLASKNGHKDVVELLLAKGADIHVKDNLAWTPLRMASKNGHKDVVELLLAKGADIDVKNNGLFPPLTPLQEASQYGHKDVVELLLAKGADIHVKDNLAWSPLRMASKNGHKDVVELLLAKGADIDVKNNGGLFSPLTPLQEASQYGHKDVVELLLAKGADIHVKDNNGMTPLHGASQNGHKDVVELLLAKGADIHVKDNSGSTPLEPEVVGEMLQEFGTLKGQVCLLQVSLETSEANEASLTEQVHTLKLQLEESEANVQVFQDRFDSSHSKDEGEEVIVRIDPDTCTRVSVAYINHLTDHFSDHRVVGRGAFGTAYRGIDLVTNLTLIVKALQSETDFESNRTSVEHEVELLERIRHPNIIRLVGWSLSLETRAAYLVYEHGEHGSLADNLVDDTKARLLVPPVRMRIAAGIAKALAFMHNPKQGGGQVFHRDVKSANVVLTATLEPKLIDCGLAFMVPDAPQALKHPTFTVTTQARQRGFGTPAYSCPRYLMNNSRYGERNEIYSLGLVLSELFSGRVLESMSDEEDVDDFRIDAESSGLHIDARCESDNAAAKSALENLRGVAQRCLGKSKHRPSSRVAMMELVALDRQQQASMTPQDAQRQTEHGWRLRLEVETQQRLRLENQLRAETAALRALRDEAIRRERDIEVRTAECLVCYEEIVIGSHTDSDSSTDKFTAVGYLECRDGHTLCRSCAQAHIRECCNVNYNGPGRVRDTHELLCPNHPGECLAVPYTNAQLAAVLGAAAYETYLRSIMIVREQELEQQFRNDLERTLAERQQESDIDRHVRVICDEMLTLRCPNSLCRRALIDFDGCTALTCDLCDRAFCGLCLEDCGRDAHVHVAHCQWNPNEDGDVFVEEKSVAAIQDRVKGAKIADYLNNVQSQAVRIGVEERLTAELKELGVELP